MLPPLDSSRTSTPVTVPAQAGSPSHNPDPVQAAHDVLNTGKGSWFFGVGENDNARMAELAKQLDKGDPTYREQLMTEIFKEDPNAFGSWFTPARAQSLVNAPNGITITQEGEMASAFAAAYNHGAIQKNTIGIANSALGGQIKDFSSLDNLVTPYETGGVGMGEDRVGSAQRVRQFLDFLGTSDSADVAQFRQAYGQHLIDDYVLNPAVGQTNPMEQNAAAGLATNLLAGDLSRPDMAVNVLTQTLPNGEPKYSFSQIQTIMESAAHSNGAYGEQSLQGVARLQNVDARDVSVPNGAALLMDSVSLSAGQNADTLAVEFARLPKESPSIFDKHAAGYQENVDSLTLAVNQHSQAVLDSFTDKNGDFTGNQDSLNSQQYIQNGTELAALFRTTLFNPDSTYGSMLQASVTKYAGALKQQVLNQVNPVANGVHAKASTQLAMLFGSLDEGVRLGYKEIADNQAARQQMLGTILDIAMSGIPMGDWAKGGVEKLLKTFAGHAAVQKVLKNWSGSIIDQATGQINSTLKQNIIDAFSTDASQANLELDRTYANGLRDGIYNQMADDNPNKEYLSDAPDNIFAALQRADGG